MAAVDKKVYDQRILCQKRENESSENVVLVAINMFMIIKSLSCIDIFVFVVYGLTGSSPMWFFRRFVFEIQNLRCFG